MPNIVFKTNPVSRLVNGLESKASLSIHLSSNEIDVLSKEQQSFEQQLKKLLTQKMNHEGFHVQIKAMTVNTHALTHVSQLYKIENGSDFKVEVIELSKKEIDALNDIKGLKVEIKTVQSNIAEQSTILEALQQKANETKQKINTATVKLQALRGEMSSKITDLRRLIPQVAQQATAPVAGQKGTIFASPLSKPEATTMTASATLQNNQEQVVDLIPAAISSRAVIG